MDIEAKNWHNKLFESVADIYLLLKIQPSAGIHQDSIMIVARKLIISGTVQGVGYRFFAQRAAARHQVRGYVKNIENGQVEAVAEGDEKAVENFKLDLIAGPTFSKVEHLEEIVLDSNNSYSAFRIEK